MSGPGWLFVAAPLLLVLALPAVWVAWRAELAVRVRRQARALARDLRRVTLYDS